MNMVQCFCAKKAALLTSKGATVYALYYNY